MKRIHYVIATGLMLMPLCASAQEIAPQAQKDAQKATEILINQPFSAKSLGDMTLPFMWEAQEDEKLRRLVITESRTQQPAVMTVDLVAMPPEIAKKDAAQAIASSLAEALATTTQINAEKKKYDNCGKKKCPTVDIYKAQFEGDENGNARKCAIQIVPAGKDMLVLTLCTLASKQYAPELPEVLDNFFSNMK